MTGAQFQNCPVLTVSSAEQSKGQVFSSIEWAYLRLMMWGTFVSLCSEIVWTDYCSWEGRLLWARNFIQKDTEWIIHIRIGYWIHLFFPHQYHSVILLSSDSRPNTWLPVLICSHNDVWFLGCSNNAVQEFYQSFVLVFYWINITFLGFIVQEL